MPTKQWLQVEVDDEIVMYLLLSLISNLDYKPFSVLCQLKQICEVSIVPKSKTSILYMVGYTGFHVIYETLFRVFHITSKTIKKNYYIF